MKTKTILLTLALFATGLACGERALAERRAWGPWPM